MCGMLATALISNPPLSADTGGPRVTYSESEKKMKDEKAQNEQNLPWLTCFLYLSLTNQIRVPLCLEWNAM